MSRSRQSRQPGSTCTFEHGLVAVLRRRLEGREHQRLPLRFDERAERHERFRPARALIDRPQLFLQPRLRLAPRRQIGNRARAPPTGAFVRSLPSSQQHVLSPAADPHLAAFAALEQPTLSEIVRRATSTSFLKWLALPSGATMLPGRADGVNDGGMAHGFGPLSIDVVAQIAKGECQRPAVLIEEGA